MGVRVSGPPPPEEDPVPETETAPVVHRIRWFVWAWNADGARAKLRHTATMRGTWGWDAECACGWSTNTGGAIKGYVKDQVWLHKNGYAAA